MNIENRLKIKAIREVEKIHSNEYFENLIEEYGNLIFSICYRFTNHYFDAQDLAQETFLSAYRSLDQFDGTYPKAWLTRIATNKCLDYQKQAARKTSPTEDSFFLTIEEKQDTLEEICLNDDIRNRLLLLIRKLEEPYQSIAYDYFYLEMSPKEIAEKKQKNVKTIQTQIYRTKARMKKLWKEVF